MGKLYLDDDWVYRNPIDNSWDRAYSYNEFVEYIQKNGLPEEISFDHDLGLDKDGKDCANWLIDYCLDNNYKLPKYTVHSANPVGAENIDKLFKQFIKFSKEEELNKIKQVLSDIGTIGGIIDETTKQWVPLVNGAMVSNEKRDSIIELIRRYKELAEELRT